MFIEVSVDNVNESSCFAAIFVDVGRPGKFTCEIKIGKGDDKVSDRRLSEGLKEKKNLLKNYYCCTMFRLYNVKKFSVIV